MKYSLIILSVVLLFSCSTQKKQAELLELTKPSWLKERPVSSDYYYGIGITPKIGSPVLYTDKAKERALADISTQINSTIKSEAMFYQVEDRHGVHEYLQNRIKSVSSEYLEGYEYIEKWEDLSNVYAFYRLSKQKYQEVKERRRREAFKLATEKYLAGLNIIEKGLHISAIEHFGLAIDALSGYMNESTVTEINGKKVDLVSESTNKLNTIINELKIVADSEAMSPSNYFVVYDNQTRLVSNCPIQFKYSGGYLINDKVKSDANGKINMPDLPNSSNGSNPTLRVEIDLVNLGRQVSKNLYVRKVIEQQKAASIVLGK